MSESKTIQFTFYLIILFLAIISIWIYFTEIDEIIRAEGAVEPAGQVRTVSSRFPGIVRNVNVKVGDRVKSNEVVIVLNKEEAEGALDKNVTSIKNIEGELARLDSESKGNKNIVFLTGTSKEIIQTQSYLFNTRYKILQNELLIINDEIEQSKNKTREIKQIINGSKALLKMKREEYSLYKPLVKQGAEPKIILLQLKSNIQELKNKISTNQTRLNGEKIEIKTLKQKQNQLIIKHQSNAQEKFSSKENELRLLKTETKSLRERLKNSRLRSPVSGIVTKVEVAGSGTVIRSGEPILEIVPISNKLIIKARLLPQDIASLKLGQECNISLNAYDYTTYGKMLGFISQIAQNTTRTQNGDVYYDIWIEARSTKLNKSNIKPEIVPGMLVQVEIIGEKRTILEYIMKPILDVSNKALTEK